MTDIMSSTARNACFEHFVLARDVDFRDSVV